MKFFRWKLPRLDTHPMSGQVPIWNETTQTWVPGSAGSGGPHRDSHEGGTDKVRHEYIEGHGSNTHAQIDSGLSAAAGHAAAAAPHSGHANVNHEHSPSQITGTAVITTDPRLSDARTPTTHVHSPGDVAGTAVVTDDARLTDARVPTVHDGTKHSTAYEAAANKGQANGYAGLGADGKVPLAQLPPLGGGTTPAWHGVLAGAYGDSDPHRLLHLIQDNPINATPTNISITVARCAYFRVPANLTVNKIRAFGVGATTSVYRCAIYRASDRARLTAELAFSTASQAWVAIGSGLGVTLTAGELYFVAVSVNAVGTTAGLQCIGSTTGRIGVLPTGWPGSLNIDLASPIIQPFAFAQFPVTNGALPNPAATLVARAAWTGGMPGFFLDSNNG